MWVIAMPRSVYMKWKKALDEGKTVAELLADARYRSQMKKPEAT